MQVVATGWKTLDFPYRSLGQPATTMSRAFNSHRYESESYRRSVNFICTECFMESHQSSETLVRRDLRKEVSAIASSAITQSLNCFVLHCICCAEYLRANTILGIPYRSPLILLWDLSLEYPIPNSQGVSPKTCHSQSQGYGDSSDTPEE